MFIYPAGCVLVLLCGAAPAVAGDPILWQPRERIDLAAAPVPAPRPPSRFVSEDTSGRTPKITVRDARGRTRAVKFGPEVEAETFTTRLVWAMGYHSDATWFVPHGRVAGTHHLQRARHHIDAHG